jgi:hypothetical protein
MATKRHRRNSQASGIDAVKFAYADPPYYRQGKRLYGDHPDAAVWDDRKAHLELIDCLNNDFDGWVMSCNPADLSWLLPHDPDVRVCAWAKTFHQIRPLCSVQYAWEFVLLKNGRQIKNRKPMVRDWLACARSMRKGLVGAKPAEFNVWILDLLGFDPDQDTITDLFPGTNGLAKVLETYQPI